MGQKSIFGQKQPNFGQKVKFENFFTKKIPTFLKDQKVKKLKLPGNQKSFQSKLGQLGNIEKVLD